jgi:FAD/FMN-containing dehydrogenase
VTTAAIDQSLVATLRELVHGTVIAPGDDGYDAARTLPSHVDLHPGAIVKAADASDVQAIVRHAAASGVELAVRSGGHSGAGHGSSEGGIQLDLTGLRDIELDVAQRTVWAGTGLTAGELTKALSEHGLAVGFGDTGSVGIGGITTGGGIGYLVRKHGLTIDSVLAADVVTADGELVRTDANQHPDLFWAIRGGGGNFGIVTRFLFRLHEVPRIVGGMLLLPATAETVAGFVAAAEAAPEELSAIANVMPCPPMPFVPEEQHGSLVIMGMLAFAGDEAAGSAAIAPFRALATPLADFVKPMAYAEMFPAEPGGPAPIAVSRTMFLESVDVPLAGRIVDEVTDHARTPGTMFAVAQLRVLGGAMARVPADATAFAHRSSRIMVALAALFESPEDRAAHTEWVESLAASIRQGDAGAYVNFLLDEGPERVRAAYPGPTWDRLVAIKRRYDPTNLFRRNQNIPPLEPAGA